MLWVFDLVACWPENPVRQFQLLYCMWLSAALCYTIGPQTRFLAWFHHSGLKLATKRGLGAHPCKLYGLIPPPVLSPQQFQIVGLALIGCLMSACLPLAPRVFLFLGFVLSLCYFPQVCFTPFIT